MLAESKICKFKMSSRINEDIVRFDVPMNIVHFMHILNSQDKFCHIESGFIFREDIFIDQKSKQISTWNPFHRNVEIVYILKSWSKFD